MHKFFEEQEVPIDGWLAANCVQRFDIGGKVYAYDGEGCAQTVSCGRRHPFQLIKLEQSKDAEEYILKKYDLDICQNWFDGDRITVTHPRAVHDKMVYRFIAEPRSGPHLMYRILKYTLKGVRFSWEAMAAIPAMRVRSAPLSDRDMQHMTELDVKLFRAEMRKTEQLFAVWNECQRNPAHAADAAAFRALEVDKRKLYRILEKMPVYSI